MNAVTSTIPYTIEGLGRNTEGNFFVKVRNNLATETPTVIVSLTDLQNAPERAMSKIPGLISTQTKNQFKRDVEKLMREMKPSFSVATKTGFSGNSFVLPNGRMCGRHIEVCLPEEILRYGERFGTDGTLKDWKEVAVSAKGNSRLSLALALPFAGPVVELLNLPAPMINLFGSVDSGKTTIAKVAGSVVGGDENGLFGDDWNNTLNNIEFVAAAHHATFSSLDETKNTSIQVILDVVMRLDQGHVKGRMTDVKLGRKFKVPIISTSNHSLCQLAERAGVFYDEAHTSRMIDIPLPVGGDGAFENLHGMSSASDLCTRMFAVIKTNHGVAFRSFLRQLTGDLEDGRAERVAWLSKRRDFYLTFARARISSNLQGLDRVHGRFATIYAAGCLAIEYNLLLGPFKELARALLQCELDHVAHVAPLLDARRRSEARRAATPPLNPMQRLVEHVKMAKLVDLRLGLPVKGEYDHESCPGYIFKGAAGVEYLFSHSEFVRICGGHREARELKAELEAAGHLIRDTHRRSTRRQVWQSRKRERVQVVAIRAEALS